MNTNLQRIEARLRRDIDDHGLSFPSYVLVNELMAHCTSAMSYKLRMQNELGRRLVHFLETAWLQDLPVSDIAQVLEAEFGVVLPPVEYTRQPVSIATRLGATLRKLFNALTGAR